MEEADLEFAAALAEAKREGYAEADDSLDVDGHDTAHKAAVLAALAYGFWVHPGALYTEGLRHVEKQDLPTRASWATGSSCWRSSGPIPTARWRCGCIRRSFPQTNLLASVRGVFNAVLVRGDVAGDTISYGRGAGGDPTASAVLSDLAHRSRAIGRRSRRRATSGTRRSIRGSRRWTRSCRATTCG